MVANYMEHTKMMCAILPMLMAVTTVILAEHSPKGGHLLRLYDDYDYDEEYDSDSVVRNNQNCDDPCDESCDDTGVGGGYPQDGCRRTFGPTLGQPKSLLLMTSRRRILPIRRNFVSDKSPNFRRFQHMPSRRFANQGGVVSTKYEK